MPEFGQFPPRSDEFPTSIYGHDGSAWQRIQLDANKYLKTVLQAASAIVGKVRLVSGGGDEVTDDTADAVKVCQATHDNLNANANLQVADADVGDSNPVPVDGANGTFPITVGAQAPQLDDVDKVAVSVYGKSSVAGDTPLLVHSTGTLHVTAGVASGPIDGLGNSWLKMLNKDDMNAYPLGVMPIVYNEETWDRLRGNVEVTVLASGARTATTNSADQTNYNHRGVMLCLDVTAVVDTPSITLHIQGKFGTNYEDLLIANTAITAVGIHSYCLYPGNIVAVDDIVEISELPLPRTWRVRIVHADTDSITYSVVGSVIV